MLIKEGTCVEVAQRSQEEYCWQFLQVLTIYTGSQSPILRGIKLTRHRHLRGLLPRFKNEVCALYDIDKEDQRLEDIQAAVEIPVTEVIRTRALSRTNNAFPSHRFNRSDWKTVDDIENKAGLVQRWKFYRHWLTAEAMASKKSYSGAVVRLRCSEIKDPYFRVADEKLRNEFRGGIIRGGSFRGGQTTIPTVYVDEAQNAQAKDTVVTLGHDQKYTVDDVFCGAGGASDGGRQAGFQIILACDKDHAACETYRKNFPETTLKQMSICQWIEESGNSTAHSDISHFSPPCQAFSPAHTRVGKDDEVNAHALFAIEKFLEIRRSRISTGEQTFGLLFDRNEEFFNALVGQYTALGYSFSWDVLQFKHYGLPSIRRRLIWIASCPGENLPPFPKPTNAEGRGLPAPVTLRDVLNQIKSSRHRDPLHDVELMLYKARNSAKFPRKPYDDRCQIGTVTTSGSEWAHPSGQRNFTLRELAYIQGFPRSHKFVGTMTQISRQIGNAFPPVVVEILYRHLKEWLWGQDRVVPLQPVSEVITERSSRNAIILDPVEDAVIVPWASKSNNIIIIDDEEYHNQDGLVRPNEQHTRVQMEDAIIIDDSEDIDMIDLPDVDTFEDYPTFSRESSRTLSAESLPFLAEMEMEVSEDNVASVAGRHLEGRIEARTHRRSLFYQN
ncbi:S-adenosyl-L-methionine-dependent methyltransferase [Xylaria telfairii]|nr:S-adenosyl-L-methionine-dependent methyltransferase [Xylaria telfairii]